MTELAFLELQQAQQRHDQQYHPDIIALGTIGRLKHMALHNAKYAARFASALEEGDQGAFERALVDSFIISLSTANVLTFDLSSAIRERKGKESSSSNKSDFAYRYLQEVGLMAKACESVDHLEDFPFRPKIAEANLSIVRLLVAEAARRGIDLAESFADRLNQVEANSGFSMFVEQHKD